MSDARFLLAGWALSFTTIPACANDELDSASYAVSSDQEQQSWDGLLVVASSDPDQSGRRVVFLYSKLELVRALVQVENGGWVKTDPTPLDSTEYIARRTPYRIAVKDKLRVLAISGSSGFEYEFEVSETDGKLVFSKLTQTASTSVLLTPPPESAQASSAEHPPFSNRYNYARRIDPDLQARAQREANILAQYSYRDNQRRWSQSGGALGHPVGVPAGYVGGTGCSWPAPPDGWTRSTANSITTCEPGGARFLLVAEAVAYNAKDGVWYASRIWQPY